MKKHYMISEKEKKQLESFLQYKYNLHQDVMFFWAIIICSLTLGFLLGLEFSRGLI